MNADEFIRSGSRSVKGWLAQESARLVQVVSDAQSAAGTRGSLGEIGIAHGRLFMLLYLLARRDERLFAVDLFEMQNLNVDHSGFGNRQIFERHLMSIGADMSRVSIVKESSLNVTADQLQALAGPARMFSVDGGHTTAIALNDLTVAESSLVDGGVVVVDDVFQYLFPGVSAAFARYMLGAGRLVPFAVSPEKVLLTHSTHHDRILAAVRDGLPDLFVRTEDMYGHLVAIIGTKRSNRERLQVGIANTDAYKRVRQGPIVGNVVEAARPTVLRLLGRG